MLNKKKVALLGAMTAAAMASTGAQAETVTANAEVEIIAAVQLSASDPLDFGIVAPGAAAGTVGLDATTGARNCSLGLSCVGITTRGGFTVNAAIGQTVAITVPPTVTLQSNGNTMVVTLVRSAPTIVMTTASQQFFVGGSLAVGAGQPAGAYFATYAVTADYQ